MDPEPHVRTDASVLSLKGVISKTYRSVKLQSLKLNIPSLPRVEVNDD